MAPVAVSVHRLYGILSVLFEMHDGYPYMVEEI